MSRRYAREMAMKTLFEVEVGKNEREFVLENVGKRIKNKVLAGDFEYFKSIVNYTLDNQKEIDYYIDKYTENWSLERLSKVDLAILRLALAEIFYMVNIPYKVTINEAIEIAKKYSTSDSPAYINGVLDEIVKSFPESEKGEIKRENK